ncbi:type II/IV secretion system ATPase subunit [Natrarchaeobaculum sulfurireducens]|uniref:Flagella-related protein FlaI n=1 Tax=Natrarchaeobaculum sulfurireducens TaxID=2044521 RepID=A0A346PPC5_9EURY|nr:type II/IV secretion system ATPase subunit [Natrarchaeobaculum sulfurireducens]AXR81370.1 Flagella-related protein FlaI [Natrarchaeobaculum sulfurireducens]
MAIDEADQSDAGDFSEGEASDSASEEAKDSAADLRRRVRVGTYTWAEFMEDHGHGDEVSELYPSGPEPEEQLGLDTDEGTEPTVPSGDDWDDVSFDPEPYLGFHPDELEEWVLPIAGDNRDVLEDRFLEYVDPETTPVVKDVWTWEHYKWEYYYDDDGSRPRDKNGEIVPHDDKSALGFDPDETERRLAQAGSAASALADVVDERTVNVQDELDEDEFFSNADGTTTVSNRYDLEKAVPLEKKTHYREVERYWVNKPYAYVVIFHSEKENEKKYYVIEPYVNEIETELTEFLSGKLRTAIKYSDEGIKEKASEDGRRSVIEDETRRLLKRYDLFEKTASPIGDGLLESVKSMFADDETDDADDEAVTGTELEGIEVRPEPILLAEDPDTLNEYQVEKLLYLLKRNFIGYERIDGIKHDINVEDISCDGYNSPVFVYHSEYEQIISNIYHGEDELDDFVVKLAQRSGKGISKRLPQVDATLPDGSRAQLTLGKEVSDHGTNYTIRQFKDVPFTPIDLINWNTFSLDEMAFLWLAIENHKSLIFAGGTASGKTTSLNAVSLFIPSSAKIVSIEDTREVELPQRNWIASVTRPSFSDDEQGDVDEFDLLEAALRQRPDYIVMGEIRGEEGRTLFQVMSTGHTTYTTFHADSVDEVLKRFTTDPINVSKTMFTALDLVSIQTQTRVQGRKVRRNKSLTEINHYEAEHDEINVQDVYQWQAETDEFLKMGDSNTLEEIRFDRGWNREKLEHELFKREVILAYLIKNGLNTYAEVAATVQAFINDPETILTLIANGDLEESLEDLREMESVLIDVDPEKEALVPRPDATTETYNLSTDLLERAEESLFEEFRGKTPSGLSSALGDVEEEEPIDVEQDDEADGFDFDSEFGDDGWEFDDATTFSTEQADDEQPAWLTDDGDFDAADADAGEPVAEAESDANALDPAADGESDADDPDPLPAVAADDTADTIEAETAELDTLFDDMGDTLETISDLDDTDESSATSDAGSMFPDGKLEAVFDPRSERDGSAAEEAGPTDPGQQAEMEPDLEEVGSRERGTDETDDGELGPSRDGAKRDELDPDGADSLLSDGATDSNDRSTETSAEVAEPLSQEGQDETADTPSGAEQKAGDNALENVSSRLDEDEPKDNVVHEFDEAHDIDSEPDHETDSEPDQNRSSPKPEGTDPATVSGRDPDTDSVFGSQSESPFSESQTGASDDEDGGSLFSDASEATADSIFASDRDNEAGEEAVDDEDRDA